MKNKNNWRVQLSQRDKLILRDLFYSKGLDLSTLLQRHFKNRHKSTVVKRLHRLYDGRYLTKGAISKRSESQIVYTITPKGLKEIQGEFSGQLIREELKSANPEHDLQVAKIFDRLLSARSLVEIKSENEIQSIHFGDFDADYEPFRRLNTDIYFSVLIKEREYKIAVEFERTQKESNRWGEYLLNYHMEGSVDVVLYICNDLSILNGLKKIESDLAKKFSEKIFFCTLKEFNSDHGTANFINTCGRSFTLSFEV